MIDDGMLHVELMVVLLESELGIYNILFILEDEGLEVDGDGTWDSKYKYLLQVSGKYIKI